MDHHKNGQVRQDKSQRASRRIQAAAPAAAGVA